MGLLQSLHGRPPQRSSTSGSPAASPGVFDCLLPAPLLPSAYQQRVARLAREALDAPPALSLEETLRQCIGFCYRVLPERAQHVCVSTVFADNPEEHQHNAPVYTALLVAWGEPGFEHLEVKCRAIAGTDVQFGKMPPSPFWSRKASTGDGRQAPCRALMHQLLAWFVALDDGDARKQLLQNMLLQLHEACYNCIGRHKEVFEYCMYDLMQAESEAEGEHCASSGGASGSRLHDAGPEGRLDVEVARKIVRRFAAQYLDKHKRAALHGTAISPLKFLYQGQYEVFENLDSHGASFWASALNEAFFPGLQLPFESIVELDKGWSWAARHFLPTMAQGADREALLRLSAPENLGRDWRQVTAGLRPSGRDARRLPGLTFSFGEYGFQQSLREAKRPNSPLREALAPYAVRFAEFMARPLLLKHCLRHACTSERWDLDIGPALAALAPEALGVDSAEGPRELRQRLFFGGPEGGGSLAPEDAKEDIEALAALLSSAGVEWASATAVAGASAEAL
mmetsp:Transcript_89034/g.232128  ORF Transcript_89034/g.232128 Transcript_89034/m.232128 type:complete len:511 (+) Transcript_89034:64-1596(+)